MSREKNLAKNTIIITIGKVCTQLITFFLLPLYTGILSTEEYGIVDLLNTLVSLMLPIITFQVEQAVFRELIEVRNNNEEKTKIISTAVITVISQCILYLILFAIISPFIKNNYKVFLATNVITSIFLSLFQQITRGFGDNKRYALGSFISALFIIIFNILFLVVFKLSANGMLLGTMCGQLVAIIYLFISLRLFNYIKLKEYKKELIRKLWKYSIPLIPNAISWWIFNASDRVIVTSILGVDQNGILAASLKFSTVFITFYNIFNISWTESISIAINDDDVQTYFNKTFNVIINLFTAMAVGMIACMPFVFPIMINEKFAAGFGLVPISIIASLFNVVVGLISVIYVAKKNTKAIANTSVVSAIINIIVHLALIKFVGLYAAVISTFVSFFVMSIYRLIDIRKRYFDINVEKKLILKFIPILIIVLILYYLKNPYFNVLSLLIAIVFAWNINKDSCNILLGFVRKKFLKRSKKNE